MLFQFPENVKIERRQIGTVRSFLFPNQLSLCNHIQTIGAISRWLNVTLYVVHMLSIFHGKSLYSWSILVTKNVMPRILQRWIKFTVDAPFPSHTTHQRLSLFEWNCYHWKPWSWTIVYAGLVLQCCHQWRNKYILLLECPLYR